MSSINATSSALTPTTAAAYATYPADLGAAPDGATVAAPISTGVDRAAAMFQRIDTDADGSISRAEFTAFDAQRAERRHDRFEGGPHHGGGLNGPGRPDRSADHAAAVQGAAQATSAGGDVSSLTNEELQQTVATLSAQVQELVAQLQAFTGASQLSSTSTATGVTDAQAAASGFDVNAAVADVTGGGTQASTSATGNEVASDATLSQLPAAQQQTLQAAVNAGLTIGADGAGNYYAQDAASGAVYAIAADGTAAQVDIGSDATTAPAA